VLEESRGGENSDMATEPLLANLSKPAACEPPGRLLRLLVAADTACEGCVRASCSDMSAAR